MPLAVPTAQRRSDSQSAILEDYDEKHIKSVRAGGGVRGDEPVWPGDPGSGGGTGTWRTC
jgi:hypothetical protein